MTSRRAIATLALTPLLLAGPAQAEILPGILEPIIRGGYGVAVTVCYPHVSSNPVEVGSTTVPVCAGSCEDVDVPTPGFDGSPLCVAWTDSDGDETEECIYFGPY